MCATYFLLGLARLSKAEKLWMIGGRHTMAIPVVEFSREGYKIRKVFD